MALKIINPYCIEQSGKWTFPTADSVSDNDRLFIVSDNKDLAESVISSINDRLSSRKSFSASTLSQIVDEAITTGNNNFSSSSIALAFITKSNCIVMQMGKSRVLQLSPTDGEIQYDSSNQILDTLSSKVKTYQINGINTNDIIVVTLTDRVDSQRLLRQFCDNGGEQGDYLLESMAALLGKHQDETPATYIIQFSSSSSIAGNIKKNINDINWKWITLFIFLATLIIAVSYLSFNGNISLFEDNQADTVMIENVDTARTLAPAIDTIEEIKINDENVLHDTVTKRINVQKEEPQKENKVESEIDNSTSLEPSSVNEANKSVEPTEPLPDPVPIATQEE